MNKINSNKSFGIVFFVVFFIISFWDFNGEYYQIKFLVAGVTGLEPATSGVTGQRSNQLSYTPSLKKCIFYLRVKLT